MGAAEAVGNDRRGYSLTFPDGWALKPGQKDFIVAGPKGVELSELPLPPPPTQSLKEVTQLSVLSFELLWGCKRTQQQIELSGDKWKGQVAVMELQQKNGKATKHLVLLVAKAGKDFRQFYFSMPTSEWQQHSEQYLSILRTLKFPAR